MFEGTLERLLKAILDPYVDGLTKDQLHLGVARGSLELLNLRLKPEILALLGFPDFVASSSKIGCIKIVVPWSALFNKSFSVQVDVVHLEVEHLASMSVSDAEAHAEIRKTKASVIEARAQQLRNLLEDQEQQQQAEGEEQDGKSTKSLVRTIIQNLQVSFNDLRLSMVSKQQGFAFQAEMPQLGVLSASEDFRTDFGESEQVAATDGSLFKMLRLKRFGLKMAAAGASSIDGAEYILTPISIDLNVAHKPRDGMLLMRLELAAKEKVAFRMLRSQCKLVRKIQAENAAEKIRLYRAMVSEEDERALLEQDAGAAAQARYGELFKRYEANTRKIEVGAEPLSIKEIEEFRLIEDTLPVLYLARQRLKMHRELDAVEAEVSRRQAQREQEAKKQRPGFFGRMMGRKAAEPDTSQEELMPSSEREELMRQVDANTKVEDVEVPKKVKFQLAFGQTEISLIDDRWTTEEDKELFLANLVGAQMGIDMVMKPDYKMNDSAELTMEFFMLPFTARQSGRPLVNLQAVEAGKRHAGLVDAPQIIGTKEKPQSQGILSLNDFVTDDNRFVAKISLKNCLETNRNVVKLGFETQPLELNWLPGWYNRILEFVRTPESATGTAAAANAKPPARRVDNYATMVDFSKQLVTAYGKSAKEAAGKIYERLPDAIHLEVIIASPTFKVPVEGEGTSKISLGHMRLVTPEACAYNDITLTMDLTETRISATSLQYEQFDMLKPVPIHMRVNYNSASSSKVEILCQVGEIDMLLSPQACKILASMPAAFAAASRAADGPGDAAAGAAQVGTAAPLPGAQTRLQKASALVEEVASDNKLVQEALEMAKEKLQAAKKASMEADFRLQMQPLCVVLSDSIVPVLRLNMDLLGDGFCVNYKSQPPSLKADLERGSVELEFSNTRHGSWEPLLERFEFQLSFSRKLADDGVTDTHIVLRGYKPLMLSVSPTAVRVVSWYLPYFAQGFRTAASRQAEGGAAIQDSGKSSPDGKSRAVLKRLVSSLDSKEAKYRVVNLCLEPLVLEFHSSEAEDLKTTVAPTGDKWISLDKWILPNFATALTVRRESGEASAVIALDGGLGVAEVPGLDGYAELLTPHPSHRLLLLCGGLRVHNQTDLPLYVRFHEPGPERRVSKTTTPAILDPGSTCDAATLGIVPPSCSASSDFSDRGQAPVGGEGILLQPNAICAAPPRILVAGQKPQAWLSVRPAAFASSFCEPFLAGAVEGAAPEPMALLCNAEDGTQVCIMRNAQVQESAPPAVAVLATVELQPMFSLTNSLPIGKLSVDLGPPTEKEWVTTELPSLKRFNLYRLPAGCEQNIRVRARLGDKAAWSATREIDRIKLSRARTQAEVTAVPQDLDLRMQADGAPAGVQVVPVGRCGLRFECPSWFTDRTGAGGEMQVWYNGKPLPTAQSITLLPAKCLEEDCELRWGGTSSSKKFRVPAGWGSLEWQTPQGPHVFSIQAEPIAPNDLFGANCQLITLRPKLVVTNLADCEVEVRCGDKGDVVALGNGKSKEFHWPPSGKKSGAEEGGTTMFFRPRQPANSSWSKPIICSEATVGSMALTLLQEGSNAASTWSVDVATEQGALAVSFRQGSDFVAVNRAAGSKVVMHVRPDGYPAALADLEVQPGEEVPYGWMEPTRKLAARIRLTKDDGTSHEIKVKDVQATMQQPVNSLGVILSISASQNRVLLILQNSGVMSLGASDTAELKGSRLTAEVKLSRIGVSLIRETPSPCEFLYMQLQLVRLEYKLSASDIQHVRLVVSEAQVDCQLAGRVDGRDKKGRQDDSESLGLVEKASAAVLMANCGEGDSPFLDLQFQRVSTSSRDFLLPSVKIQLDSLDTVVDEEWLGQLKEFMSDTRSVPGAEQEQEQQKVGRSSAGRTLWYIRDMAGKSILEDYTLPPLPSVVALEELEISDVNLTTWCKIGLKNIHFLNPQLRLIIQILSVSGNFVLEGASISVKKQKLPPHRGSAVAFVKGLVNAYTMDLLGEVASVLGRSSLLNVPRVPLKFVGTGFSFFGDVMSSVADEGSSLVNMLTFDEEYIKRQQQIRSNKRINNLGDGLVEAGRALGTGVEGITEIFTAPLKGAKEGGVGGFFSGLGMGLAGAVVKPMSAVGQAVGNVAGGVSAQVTQIAGTNTKQGRRNEARQRGRLPRLLYSGQGMVRPWSSFDAQVLQQLGSIYMQNVEVVLPLLHSGSVRKALVLFESHMLLASVAYEDQTDMITSGAAASSSQEQPTDQPKFGAQIFSQALRPISTVAGAVRGVGHITGIAREGPARGFPGVESVQKSCSSFGFAKFAEVSIVDDEMRIKTATGDEIKLDLSEAQLGPAAREALMKGFRSVLAPPGGGADWEPLLNALLVEKRRHQSQNHAASEDPGAKAKQQAGGSRRLEVFEVESQVLYSGDFQTPWMFNDTETSWRWVDATFTRHPHLKKGITKDQIIKKNYKSEEPPCELELFEPAGPWVLEKINGVTDEQGWQYAMTWSASTWATKPGIFDVVRKRRWTREYQ